MTYEIPSTKAPQDPWPPGYGIGECCILCLYYREAEHRCALHSMETEPYEQCDANPDLYNRRRTARSRSDARAVLSVLGIGIVFLLAADPAMAQIAAPLVTILILLVLLFYLRSTPERRRHSRLTKLEPIGRLAGRPES